MQCGRTPRVVVPVSGELTLPGETIVPTTGVTAVGVLPSHRRQGVLSAMMRHQLTELRARGEVLSVLLASEALIYRRFGYGPATLGAAAGRPARGWFTDGVLVLDADDRSSASTAATC
jgi:predicted N-acetyltransferase YhbS